MIIAGKTPCRRGKSFAFRFAQITLSGNFPGIEMSHVSARVLALCITFSTPAFAHSVEVPCSANPAAAATVARPDEALPKPENFLFWTPAEQAIGYRSVEKIFPTHTIAKGTNTTQMPLAGCAFEVFYDFKGKPFDTAAFMEENRISGLLVLKNGKTVLERYGLGRTAADRWTSFSVAKSITSTLVGAAIKDGLIKDLDAPVTDYIRELKGSAYEGVTIRQLLTMSSGVKWNEDYEDPKSDVNVFARYEPQNKADNPIAAYMAKLPREAEPGTKFVYKTGESDLIGVLLSRVLKVSLSDYLSEKIWKPMGAEKDGVWMTDQSGTELGGCCISMTLRDYGRFGMWFAAGGGDVLPKDWTKEATAPLYDSHWAGTHYGFQWWIYPDGSYAAVGIFGQMVRIYPKENLVIVTNSAWPHADEDANYEVTEAYITALRKTLN